jgi:REP element-mobilizing transposase RayT
MPRIARVVVPKYPHHVTQRGNRRQTVFFSAEDYATTSNFWQMHATIWQPYVTLN